MVQEVRSSHADIRSCKPELQKSPNRRNHDLYKYIFTHEQSTDGFTVNPNLQLLQQQLYKQEQMWQLSDLNKNLSTYKHTHTAYK